jgi:hypothetical protein
VATSRHDLDRHPEATVFTRELDAVDLERRRAQLGASSAMHSSL